LGAKPGYSEIIQLCQTRRAGDANGETTYFAKLRRGDFDEASKAVPSFL
jgi:hypothetical protein